MKLSQYLGEYSKYVKSYEKDMLAAASIGQIYKGKDYDDNDIVIKIKNNDIDKDIQKWENS